MIHKRWALCPGHVHLLLLSRILIRGGYKGLINEMWAIGVVK